MTLLPTELVGSYALPGWLLVAEERQEQRGDLGESDLRELLDDAVRIAVVEQEAAGLDTITDGEMRRRDFIQSFYDRLSGLRTLPPARRLGAAGYDQNPRRAVVDRITAPDGLGLVEELEYLRTVSAKPVKLCVPGPFTLAQPLILEGGYGDQAELLSDIATIVNTEMRAVVAAGASYLQVDEPRYTATPQSQAAFVELFNRTRDGVEARVGLHVCFGNFKGRSRDRRDYGGLFPGLLDARADQFNLEFANREFHQIELLAELPERVRVGVGVIDVKSYFVESPQEVASSIRLALRHANAEQLVITPDCGFNHCPRHVARKKMEAMVQGAALVRAELEG